MPTVVPFAGKTRLAVKDALSKDLDTVDPAVLRGLTAVAQELDEHAQNSENAHVEIMEALDERAARIERSLKQVQTLLITTTLTFFAALVTGVVGMILN